MQAKQVQASRYNPQDSGPLFPHLICNYNKLK